MKRFCYHHDDEDGWASAAIVELKHPETDFQECHNDYAYDLVSGYDEVYVVDFSFSQVDFQTLVAQNEKVIWIDHHKSAIAQISLELEGLRDSSRAACALTWLYCFPEHSLPPVIAHIEDVDLWKFSLEYTSEFLAYLNSLLLPGKEVGIIKNILETYSEKDYASAYEIGEHISRFEKAGVTKQAHSGVRQKLFGHEAVVFFASRQASLLGHIALDIYADAEIAVIIRYIEDTSGQRRFKYSLRSRHDEVDVSEIASRFGGGGHAGAAGFVSESLILADK
ncbi:MAG: DHHA1 domain-containing protein [Candidatus Woesearchaeota archaeon]